MPADRGDAACIVAGVRKWRRCFESLAACVPSDAGNLQVHHCRAPCRANFGISAQAPDIARAAGAHHRRVGRHWTAATVTCFLAGANATHAAEFSSPGPGE